MRRLDQPELRLTCLQVTLRNESIDRRLFTLPKDTMVFPGHGLDTTVGTERPKLDEWIDRGW